MVATRKPAAVQCIRWTPDSSGSQTSTEIFGRMGWLEKKVTIKEMVHDRPMNLSTWITSDGRAYAVQRAARRRAAAGRRARVREAVQGLLLPRPPTGTTTGPRAPSSTRASR